MAAGSTNEPTVLSRLERLDVMLCYLEEMRGSRPSTTSSGTLTSDGGNSSVNSSPKSLGPQCRTIDDAVAEAQLKGSLIDRVLNLESRLLKLEVEIESEKRKQEEEGSPRSGEKKGRHGKGLKRLVKSCVKGDLKTKE